MKVADFDFTLPRACIADHPPEPRDACRLLVVGPGEGFHDRAMRDLPRLLRAGDLMVFNDTRVLPARLVGRRGEAKVEVTLHKEAGPGLWRAFARPARRLRPGDRVVFVDAFAAEVAERGEGGEVTLRFAMARDALLAALERHGAMPLPPYIKRPRGPETRDRRDYQTVYARRPGAVAAPTAGLHFTSALLEALDRAGVGRAFVTLHAGAGTFLPVRVEDTNDHVMHAEWGEIGEETVGRIEDARARGGRVVAVGTTTLRLLETAAGEDGRLTPFAGETSLFITPGYRFRVADLLLTNFHLPRSTLFMLVAAFSGLARMKAAYEHAKEAGYRFYSYGDCTLLYRAEDT